MTEKLIFFVRRAPHLDRAEFQRRYLDGHCQLVREHFSRLRRYVVNLVDLEWEARAEDALAAADAIAEMWFDSVGDFTDRARRYDSAEAAIAIEEDASELFGGVTAYRVEECVQRDYERSWPDGEPSPGVKLVYPVRRAAALSREQFVQHWQGKHVPLVLRYMRGISRYATNVVVEPMGHAPEIDGIVELHYLDPDALKGPRYNAPAAEALVAEDVAQFLTPARVAIRTREHILRS